MRELQNKVAELRRTIKAHAEEGDVFLCDLLHEKVACLEAAMEVLTESPVADYAGTEYACGLHPLYRG